MFISSCQFKFASNGQCHTYYYLTFNNTYTVLGTTSYTGNTCCDITFVTQLSFQRVEALRKIVTQWNGPISAVLYGNHSDMIRFNDYINKHHSVMRRANVAYHFVLKAGVSFLFCVS